MDLLLVRLAGSRPPAVEALRRALLHQAWLSPGAGRGGTWLREFTFPGVQIHVVTTLGDSGRYAAPGLQAALMPDADFGTLAPRLVTLAGALQLGIDVSGTNGALWWPAPDPAWLGHETIDRAVAVSRSCEAREAWPFLGFALAAPECLELAESHPALAFLVANTPRLQGRYRVDLPAGERAAFLRGLARRPRRETLAALDFPASESMVRLLGKIPWDRLNLESLRLLRDLSLAPHAAKALRHLPRFGSGLIPIAVRRKLWAHIGPQLLREVAEEADEGSAFFRLRDTVEMASALGRIGDIGIVSSMAALEGLHDRLQQEYVTRPQRNLREARRREDTGRAEALRPRPPAPPLQPSRPLLPEPPPPPPGIVPLRAAADLRQEGREMNNCVGSYYRKLERGDYFVYRVLQPERATLGLRWSKIRCVWAIDQLKGFANQPVRPETRMIVRDWLETGIVDPTTIRWAREVARRRFRELLELVQQTSDQAERQRLKDEMARLRVGS